MHGENLKLLNLSVNRYCCI